MRAMDREEYEEALRAETDYRIRDRYRGVKMVLLDHMSVAKTAECMDRSYNTVKDWILRYDMYGFEGLHDPFPPPPPPAGASARRSAGRMPKGCTRSSTRWSA